MCLVHSRLVGLLLGQMRSIRGYESVHKGVVFFSDEIVIGVGVVFVLVFPWFDQYIAFHRSGIPACRLIGERCMCIHLPLGRFH